MPDLAGFWMAITPALFGHPASDKYGQECFADPGGENIGAAFHPFSMVLVRWSLAVAFLPYEAYNALDAILTTLYRLLISHHNLLQWTTAAQTARLFGLQAHRNTAWLKMIASSLMALILAVWNPARS